jgi:hypothetical protein
VHQNVRHTASATNNKPSINTGTGRAAALEEELSAARRSAARSEAWRGRCEALAMRLEDMEASLSRQEGRRGELVAAYWPVMRQLRAAERVALELSAQLRAAGLAPAAALTAGEGVPAGMSCNDDAAAAAEALTAAVGGEEGAARVEAAAARLLQGQMPLTADKCPMPGGSMLSTPFQQQAVESPAASLQPGPASTALPGRQASVASAANTLAVAGRNPCSPSNAAAAATETSARQQAAVAAPQEMQALREDHARLEGAWLLLQDEYWSQKERILGLEVEVGRLGAACKDAQERLHQVGLGSSEVGTQPPGGRGSG